MEEENRKGRKENKREGGRKDDIKKVAGNVGRRKGGF